MAEKGPWLLIRGRQGWKGTGMERRASSITTSMVFGLLVAVCVVGVPGARAAVHVLPNGITANVHTPQEIEDLWMTQAKDGTVLVHPSGGLVELTSSGEGLYPFATSEVVAALEAMHGLSAPVEVEVFILPAVPRETLSSFARRGAIFLSPGTGTVDAQTIAYITTHEMGHVLTWAFVDGQPGRWDSYLDLRGLDASSLEFGVVHAERAREIMAEDIRYLFGGPLANSSHSIENARLVLPDRVEGLFDLLQGFFQGRDLGAGRLSSTAFPNPCNPLTTIELVIPEGASVQPGQAVLRIFDIRGAVVRTLRGGQMANDRLSVPWNGTDESGRVVASGRYLYVIEIEHFAARGSVTLVR